MNIIKSFLGYSLALLLPCGLMAQQGLEIKSVSIFKDQSAFFVKDGNVKAKDKTWFIQGDTIPAALNGTFWIASPTNDFKMVKAYQKKTKKDHQAVANNFAAIISLNDGKIATFYLLDTVYTGKIMLLITPKEKEAMKQGDTPKLNAPLFVLLQSSGKSMIFTANQIAQLQRLEFDQTPTFFYDYQLEESKPTLQIDFKSNKTEQPINMMYLSKGLAWKPDYLVELIEENAAMLTLRSTVVNNAEDIKTDKLNLVAGVPNFKYATVLSDLINFLQIPQPYNQQNFATISNTIRQEAITYSDFAAPITTTTTSGGTRPANLSNFGDASSMEDLYFYTLKDIVLKKGERAFFDIFNVKVPVEHIYETVLDGNNVNYSTQYSFLKKENAVIHTIKLKNDSKYTWTAAPALVMKNDQKQYAPISQDKLHYTSQGNDVSIKLTEAPDVNVKFKEEETERIPNKKSIKKNNYTYYNDLITVETEVVIQNFKNKNIRLDVKRLITGELVESSIDWQKSPRVQYGYHFNAQTDVCWELKLKPGETKTIKYTYTYYTTEHR